MLTLLKGEKVDKEGLLNAIENLTTYTTSVKAFNSFSKSEKTERQINKSLSSQGIPTSSDTGLTPTYFLLAHPLLEEAAERLLGALILNINDPWLISQDERYKPKIESSWVHVETEENSGIYAEWIKSKRVDISAGFAYKSSSFLGNDTGSSKITTRTLNAPRSYVTALVRNHRQRSFLSFLGISKSFYMITGLKSTSFQVNEITGPYKANQMLFAARYTKIECRAIRKNIISEYNEGATF